MDIYASAALSGLGMALNQQRDTLSKQKARPVPPNAKPSMQNMYASDYWTQARSEELQRGTKMWNAAQQPMETGVVPRPAYASMFSSPLPEHAPSQNMKAPERIVTMAGQEVSRENFTHNNMQPFFRGSITQSVDPFATSGTLERHTGLSPHYQNKKEVECFFEPTANFAHVCGMPDNTDYYRTHMSSPKSRNNDFPIEQVRVGKGLGQGFTASPAGGFQQANTLEYVKPKTVDELRVATKPKTTFELPIQGPRKGITQRGEIGAVEKNRVDTYYQQTEDMWLKNGGTIKKEVSRPIVSLKPTARVDTHKEYQGQVSASVQPGMGDSDDYGKKGILVYDNERQVTETRTVISNVTSTVKAIVAPLLDVMKHNNKEYTVDAPRTYGNMQAQIPSKPTTYDPVNHMMRTTIKETTIHDTTIMNPKGPEQGTVPYMDETKKTIRETLPVEDVVRNVSSHSYRVTVYNADVAKKTVRETMKASGSMYGFVGGAITDSVGAYEHIDVQVPNTQKQFISDYEYEGSAQSKVDFRPRNQDAERNAEIDGTREALNIASGHTPNGGGDYESLDPSAVDMESKKLVQDSMASRASGNVSRVMQTPPTKDLCEITKPATHFLNGQEGRLDTALLASLKSNPYNLSINPI